MPFNKYYTNTNILVNCLSDIEMQDLGFIDFQDFWEFSKHFFPLEMAYFVRIYKKTHLLSIEVTDYDEFAVKDISEKLVNCDPDSLEYHDALSMYDIIFKQLSEWSRVGLVDISNFKYGDMFTSYRRIKEC